MNIFTSNLRRTDLDRVYYYEECEKTLAYAEEKMSVNGVLEYYKKMKVEKNNYTSDIDSIVNPKREEEEKRYFSLEKWTKIRQISAWTCIGGLIFFIIVMIFDSKINGLLEGIATLCGVLLTPVSFLMFVVTKIGEVVCSMIYERLVQDIMEKIRVREKEFIALCQKYYKEIDDLYLYSLTPEHRETVLLRRDMAEQHKEHIQMAERQLRIQEHIEDEQKRSSQIQQGILDNLNEWRDERHGLK